MRVIDRRGGDREYVIARATCECGDPILLWRTEFDDHPTVVETWKHSDGVVLCEKPMFAKPVDGTIEHVRSEP